MGRVIRGDEEPRHVLPGEVVDAHGEADRIRRAAQTEAERLVADARAAADHIRRQAEEAGWCEGQERAASLIAQAAAARDRILADAEGELPEIVLTVARRLVGEALAADPTAVRRTVQGALERARRARRIELRVHPDDVEHVRGLGEAPERSVAIEADPSIARGGCILRTDVGDVDARIEVQLAAFERALSTKT